MPEYILTGIPGVDKIMGNQGIPRGHSILVSGGPGSGKTTFSMQFLYNGIKEQDEAGLYITLDEEPEDIRKNMSGLGWDLEKLEKQLKSRLAGELKKGVELKPFPEIEAGFRIAMEDGSAYYNFTDQGIAEILAEFLNPKIAEIVQEATQKET